MTKTTASSSPTSLVSEYPRGHVGHLTSSQQEALGQFKALLEAQGLWRRGPPVSLDDGNLLRFLRARQWIPDNAAEQFRSSLNWLTVADMDKLRSTLDVEDWKQSRASVPAWTGRRDKRGQPVYYVDAGAAKEKAWTENGQASAIRAFCAQRSKSGASASMLTSMLHLDMMNSIIAPMCTRTTDRLHPEVPVTMTTYIADIGGLSLRKFWAIKNHVFCLLTSISVIFPETASRIFIVCAPPYVGIMWSWVKSWLDPVTASKVVILKTQDVKPALESFIDLSSIPVRYGGTLDSDFSNGPVLDESLRNAVDWEPGFDTLPSGPLSVETDGDRLACYTCGREKGKPRRQKVFTMPGPVECSNVSTEEMGAISVQHVGEPDFVSGMSSELNEKQAIECLAVSAASVAA
ncbi:hypothetical protein XA68_14647 [Ophiocordyceps unilateralis]|uniref:CRAL-TRIO domain-containing protein n=1 Tax=Ophiocordyceps unilateralis TaxID=268505 RepID=A0A2A9P8U5_OPHUN|nr:hypothetical protein XA68_14647 [Ophiocordyceps unilateralis]